jgi:hypothetical protein
MGTTKKSLRFQVFTAVTTKDVVFFYVTQCDSCMNQRFVGIYCLNDQGEKNSELGTTLEVDSYC